jgi:type VI secretion system secreted protein VgrG
VGAAAIVMTFGGLAVLAATTVDLGTATSFAVLAGTTVTNTGSSTIQGDLGVDPGSAVTGAPSVGAPYSTFTADSIALGAKNDLTTAYNQAATGEGTATQAGTTFGDLTGLTLTSGVYQTGTILGTANDGAMSLSGTLTLNGTGVFIFQTGSSLTMGTSSVVTGTASPCDVFWQVGSSATLDGPTFVGTVMASTSITVGSGVTVNGRVLAGTGDVTLISDTINASNCINNASLPTPMATPTAATTTGVPSSGAGGTSPFIGAGVLVTLGGLALLGTVVTTGIIRRRRYPSV